MTLRDDITVAGYRDSDGMVTPWPCDPKQVNGSGNGLMYSSEEILMSEQLGELTEKMMAEWAGLVRTCEMGQPGVFKRGPHSGDHDTSYDDYILVAAAAKFAAPDIARDILNHGKKNWGIYMNELGHKKRQWLWRNPAFIAHLYFCAGIRPNWFLRQAWQIAVESCMKSTENDGWVKVWAMVCAAKGIDPKCDATGNEWTKAAKAQPNILARTIDPAHPLSKAFIL